MTALDLAKSMLRPFPDSFRVCSGLFRALQVAPQLLRGKSAAWNWMLCIVSAALRTRRAWGRPMTLNIEPTTVCDQKCLVCEKGLGILGRRSEHMSFERFCAILDQFDHTLQNLFFYFMGESFLNKDAYRMIRYAADRGLHVHACTNGNTFDPEALVRSGIADIQFQISGTTQETHAIYRVGGKLDQALEHLRQTVAWKNTLADELVGNTYPLNIGLGFILFRHNEHQVEEFKALAKSIGVDSYEIIAPCVRTVEQGRAMLPTDRNHWLYSPEAFEQGRLEMRHKPGNYCEWLYSSVTIQVDGNVVPCCRDPHGKIVMGNVFSARVYDIWNNAKYRALRGQVATRQKDLPLCALCEGFGTLPLRQPRSAEGGGPDARPGAGA